MSRRRRIWAVAIVSVVLWCGWGPAIAYPMSHDTETLWIAPLVLFGSAIWCAIVWLVCKWVDDGD